VNDRLYPARPILAASVAVFKDSQVLIARRAREPLLGLYSLPGGAVEIGETLREAALRELAEEVGISAEVIGFIDHVEPIAFDGDLVRSHYVIAAFVARWRAGKPRTSEEADDVRWIAPEAAVDFPTTPELPRLIARAAAIERG
jgi:ADP-ribose pyrophosphatase YjhB (NUDIX family)